jgi:hypothetical protein
MILLDRLRLPVLVSLIFEVPELAAVGSRLLEREGGGRLASAEKEMVRGRRMEDRMAVLRDVLGKYLWGWTGFERLREIDGGSWVGVRVSV